MDLTIYFLVLLAIFSTQFQVVAAASNLGLAIGATLGFVFLIGGAYFLRYCVWDKKCANQVEEKKSEPVERKVNMNPRNEPKWQVGHQPYQGERPPPQQQHHPLPHHMPQGHSIPPPMANDPAYPPPMPAAGGYGQGHGQPAANPFKSASYGGQ